MQNDSDVSRLVVIVIGVPFDNDFCVLVELDGPQHFWPASKWFSQESCERDKQKEEWAVTRGMCVVRVLQQEVWEDRYDWQGWISRSIAAARSGEARPMTPERPEYRSDESAYVQLRE